MESKALNQQLARIAHKDALYKYISNLPDSARLLIICDPGEDQHFVYHRLGDFLRSEVIYMMECLKFTLLETADQ